MRCHISGEEDILGPFFSQPPWLSGVDSSARDPLAVSLLIPFSACSFPMCCEVAGACAGGCGCMARDVGAEPSLWSRTQPHSHEGHCFEGERTWGLALTLDTCDWACSSPLEPFGPCPESPGAAPGWGLAGTALGLPPVLFQPPSSAFIFLCFIFQLQDSKCF